MTTVGSRSHRYRRSRLIYSSWNKKAKAVLPADVMRGEMLEAYESVRLRRLWLRGVSRPVTCKEPLPSSNSVA
jgi:hypothetical protein